VRRRVKCDRSRRCRAEKDETDNFIPDYELMERLGSECIDDDPKKPTVIGPVALLYNDLNLDFWCSYRMYQGRTCICKGNGIEAIKPATGEKVPCNPMMCPMLRDKKCKPNGILSVMFPDAPLGGMAKFRTTSWNSIQSIMGGLTLLSLSARGKVAGIPLYLRLNKSMAQVQGKAQTIYFLSVEFQGNMQDLRQSVLEYTQEETKQVLQIEHAEEQARRELALTDTFDVDDEEQDPEEFYPAVQENESGTVVDSETGQAEDIAEPKKKAAFGKGKPKEKAKPKAISKEKPAQEEHEAEKTEEDIFNQENDSGEEEPLI